MQWLQRVKRLCTSSINLVLFCWAGRDSEWGSGNLITNGKGVLSFYQSRSKCLGRLACAGSRVLSFSFLFLNETKPSTSSLSTMSILIFICEVEY